MNKEQAMFIVEGNIGAGKSTFLTIIKRYLNLQIVPEPVDEWQVVGTENLLDKFYRDTSRWGYTFQSYAFVTRVRKQQEYAKKNTYPIQLLERSVYSDRYCFAKNCYERGFMNALEWKLYQEWFSWLINSYMPKPHGFIYLRTTPEVCYERLRKRNRSEEACVEKEYLQQLHNHHEGWLIEKKQVEDGLETIPVLTVACDQDFEHDTRYQEEIMEQVVQFMQNPKTKSEIGLDSSTISL